MRPGRRPGRRGGQTPAPGKPSACQEPPPWLLMPALGCPVFSAKAKRAPQGLPVEAALPGINLRRAEKQHKF
ncbi:MAG: hypothetical protein DBY09_00370 [Selenomonadales bacterium]|nr:MAG: hypothetical protein DBY09_00370 [Selenomonadales bacterium]